MEGLLFFDTNRKKWFPKWNSRCLFAPMEPNERALQCAGCWNERPCGTLLNGCEDRPIYRRHPVFFTPKAGNCSEMSDSTPFLLCCFHSK